MTRRAAAALVAALAASCLASAALAPRPPPAVAPRPPPRIAAARPSAPAHAPAPTPTPDRRAPERVPPRVLAPDAVRAGQVAGQLAEVRYRLARAGVECADDLEPLSVAFADARARPDAADWPGLRADLAGVLEDVDACGVPEVDAAADRLRAWLAEPPLER